MLFAVIAGGMTRLLLTLFFTINARAASLWWLYLSSCFVKLTYGSLALQHVLHRSRASWRVRVPRIGALGNRAAKRRLGHAASIPSLS